MVLLNAMEIDKKSTQEDRSAESEYKRAPCEKVTFKERYVGVVLVVM
jgi:hypothetical protein